MTSKPLEYGACKQCQTENRKWKKLKFIFFQSFLCYNVVSQLFVNQTKLISLYHPKVEWGYGKQVVKHFSTTLRKHFGARFCLILQMNEEKLKKTAGQ